MPAQNLASISEGLTQLLHSRHIWRGRDIARIPAQGTGFDALNDHLPGGGWPLGCLIELAPTCAGIGELSVTLPALRALSQTKRRLVFVNPPYVPYAPALVNAGVALSTVYWAQPRSDEDARWTAEQVLRESSAGAVLLWSETTDERALRRLQLAAEAGQALAFLYRSPRLLRHASPAAVRIALRPWPDAIYADIVKARGGRPAAVMLPFSAGHR